MLVVPVDDSATLPPDAMSSLTRVVLARRHITIHSLPQWNSSPYALVIGVDGGHDAALQLRSSPPLTVARVDVRFLSPVELRVRPRDAKAGHVTTERVRGIAALAFDESRVTLLIEFAEQAPRAAWRALAADERSAAAVCEASPYDDCIVERAPLLVCESGAATANDVVAWARRACQIELAPSLLPASSTKPQSYACIVGTSEQLRALLASPSGDDDTWRWRMASVAVAPAAAFSSPAPLSPAVNSNGSAYHTPVSGGGGSGVARRLDTPQTPSGSAGQRHTITIVHDTNNCFVPPHVGGREIDGAALYKLVVDAVTQACELDAARPRIVWRFVCNDYASLDAASVRPTSALLHGLVSRGVTRVGTSPHKGSVDGVVRQLVDEFVHTFTRLNDAAQERETFVLVSGDSDFAVDLQRVVDAGVPRVLLLNDAASCSAALHAVAPRSRGDWFELVERAAAAAPPPQLLKSASPAQRALASPARPLANGVTHAAKPSPAKPSPAKATRPKAAPASAPAPAASPAASSNSSSSSSTVASNERVMLNAHQLHYVQFAGLVEQWRAHAPSGVSITLHTDAQASRHAGAVEVQALGDGAAVGKVAALIGEEVSRIAAVPLVLYGVDAGALLADETSAVFAAFREARATLCDSAPIFIDALVPADWDRAAVSAHLTLCSVPFADVRVRRAAGGADGASFFAAAQVLLRVGSAPTVAGGTVRFADIAAWQAASDALVGTAPARRVRFSFDTPQRKVALVHLRPAHETAEQRGASSARLQGIVSTIERAQRRTASLDVAALLSLPRSDDVPCVVAHELLTGGADWLMRGMSAALATDKVGVALHATLQLVQLEGAPNSITAVLPAIEALIKSFDVRVYDLAGTKTALLDLQQWGKRYGALVRTLTAQQVLVVMHAASSADAAFALNTLVEHAPLHSTQHKGRWAKAPRANGDMRSSGGSSSSTTPSPSPSPPTVQSQAAQHKTFFYRCQDVDVCNWLRAAANEAAYKETVRLAQAAFDEETGGGGGADTSVSVSVWSDRRHPESVLRVSGAASVVSNAVAVIGRVMEPLRASLVRSSPQRVPADLALDDVLVRCCADGAVVVSAANAKHATAVPPTPAGSLIFFGSQAQIDAASAALQKLTAD